MLARQNEIYTAPRQFQELLTQARVNEGQDAQLFDSNAIERHEVYVLLGEPGMGKSTMFRALATQTGGHYLSAIDFLDLPLPDDFKTKILFIDGLDEVNLQGTGHSSAVSIVRKKLAEHHIQRFRLSCRKRDWSDAKDREAIQRITSLPVRVYNLEPLNEQEISNILNKNHGVVDPDQFKSIAAEHQLSDLLNNPQTLRMLAQATKPSWPNSKTEVYQRCSKLLALDSNREHQRKALLINASLDDILQASGYLCLMHLCTNSVNFSEIGESDAQTKLLNELDYPTQDELKQALSTRIFRSINAANTQFTPAHRTLAEYLAAQYLQAAVSKGLSLRRVLALLCSDDGAHITSLRGLLAWFLSLLGDQRVNLLKIDPIGLALYGDVKHFKWESKQTLIQLIAKQPEAIRERSFYPDKTTFSALADLAWLPWAKTVIKHVANDQNRMMLHTICTSLQTKIQHQEIEEYLESILYSTEVFPTTRYVALRSLSTLQKSEIVLRWINDLASGQLADPDDEITGRILKDFYPQLITNSQAISMLHMPKSDRLIGLFRLFWHHDFTESTPNDSLKEVLNLLAIWKEKNKPDDRDHHEIFWDVATSVLTKTLEVWGSKIDIPTLYVWLGISVGEHHQTLGESKKKIKAWIENNHQIHLQLLTYAYAQIKHEDSLRLSQIFQATAPLYGAETSQFTAQNWLNMLAVTDNRLHEYLYIQAQRSSSPDFYYPHFERWTQQHPDFRTLFESQLITTLPSWQIEEQQDAEILTASERRKEKKNQWIEWVASELSKPTNEIQSSALYQIAWGRLGHLIESRGDKPDERISSLLQHRADLVHQAENHLMEVYQRSDLPENATVLAKHTAKKATLFHLSIALFVGCGMLFERDERQFWSIPESTLEKALIGYFCYGSGSGEEWVHALVNRKTDLFAQAYRTYVLAKLKAKNSNIFGLYWLQAKKEWANVAPHVVYDFLLKFPIKVAQENLYDLEYLLKASLFSIPKSELLKLCQLKLSRPSMDSAQKVYWLTTGLISDAEKYATPLLKELESSEAKVLSFGRFLESRDAPIQPHFNEHLLSKLIQVCAPYASPNWGDDGKNSGEAVLITTSMELGEQVRKWLRLLSETATKDATLILQTLRAALKGTNWSVSLENAQTQQLRLLRDTQHPLVTTEAIDQLLASGKPQNHADFAAMINECLEELIKDIQFVNVSSYQEFWNIKSGTPLTERDENLCRDNLALKLKEKLKKYQISIRIDTEQRVHQDKRCDVWISYSDWAIPVEIKKQNNRELATALTEQLINKYTIDPQTHGHGIYLVIWFGPNGIANKFTSAPKTPDDLLKLLNERIPNDYRNLITVHILDVSGQARPPTTI